ncbi:MAG: hypothetical protein ACYCUL_04665 [Metallibacterium scheffleri]
MKKILVVVAMICVGLFAGSACAQSAPSAEQAIRPLMTKMGKGNTKYSPGGAPPEFMAVGPDVEIVTLQMVGLHPRPWPPTPRWPPMTARATRSCCARAAMAGRA